jgi:hypothetical protein
VCQEPGEEAAELVAERVAVEIVAEKAAEREALVVRVDMGAATVALAALAAGE